MKWCIELLDIDGHTVDMGPGNTNLYYQGLQFNGNVVVPVATFIQNNAMAMSKDEAFVKVSELNGYGFKARIVLMVSAN